MAKTIDIKIDIDKSEVDQLRKQLKSLSKDSNINLGIEVDDASVSDLKKELKKIKDVDIDLKINSGDAKKMSSDLKSSGIDISNSFKDASKSSEGLTSSLNEMLQTASLLAISQTDATKAYEEQAFLLREQERLQAEIAIQEQISGNDRQNTASTLHNLDRQLIGNQNSQIANQNEINSLTTLWGRGVAQVKSVMTKGNLIMVAIIAVIAIITKALTFMIPASLMDSLEGLMAGFEQIFNLQILMTEGWSAYTEGIKGAADEAERLAKFTREIKAEQESLNTLQSFNNKQIIELQAIADDDTNSLKKKYEAELKANELRKTQIKQEIVIAEKIAQSARLSYSAAVSQKKGYKEIEDAMIRMYSTAADFNNVNNKLEEEKAKSTQRSNMHKQDLYEQELDWAIDLAENKIKQEERVVNNEDAAFYKRYESIEKIKKLQKESAEEQLRILEKATGKNINLSSMYGMSNKERNKYIEDLDISEMMATRLLEVIREQADYSSDTADNIEKLGKSMVKATKEMKKANDTFDDNVYKDKGTGLKAEDTLVSMLGNDLTDTQVVANKKQSLDDWLAYELEATNLSDNDILLLKNEHALAVLELDMAVGDARIAEEERVAESIIAEEERILAEKERVMQLSMDIMFASADTIGTVLGAIADNQNENNEEGFELAKGLRIAEASINTAAGVTNALATGAPYVKWVDAASIAASGIAQIASIRNTQFDGSGASGAGGSLNAPSVSNAAPVTSGRALYEMERQAEPMQAYVVQTELEGASQAKETISNSITI